MKTDNPSELEDLAQYVAVHPEDHARRWALAKKMYMAWEYNEALKHLLVLKKEWSRKLNVLRYLAAAYYRLGLYDEAIAELRDITKAWPSEVAVWEQLARVNEVAGRTEDAAATWEQIVRINPSHPTAARSVQRLRSPSGDGRREDLRLRDSDSGIDLSPYRICRSCGAQNSDEFDRCWQCHAALRSDEHAIDSVHDARPAANRAWQRTFLGGMSTVAALSGGVYVTLAMTHRIGSGEGSGFGPVYDVLATSLLVPRLIAAAALAAAWPLSMWCAYRLTGARPLPWPTLCGAGLLLASATYLSMWLPIPWLLYAPALPAVLSFAVMLALSEGSVVQRLAAWAIHGVAVFAAGVGSFAAAAGVQPIAEMPAIVAYYETMSSVATPESLPVFAESGSGGCFVQWAATGSAWLDRNSRTIVIEAVPEDPAVQVALELRSDEGTVGGPATLPNAIAVQVEPGVRYTLRATAPDNAMYVVRSRGALQPFNEGKLIK